MVNFTHDLEIHDVIVFLHDIYPYDGICGRYHNVASDTPGMNLYTKIALHFANHCFTAVAFGDFYDIIMPDIISLMEIDCAK